MDIASEPQHILDLYGADPSKPSVANQVLLARRLVTRGVRFVQLNFGNWYSHQAIYKTMPGMCRQIDRPAAALITDLKQRGLLDDTLVIWSGEFGRTPIMQDISPDGMKNAQGRDHHKDAFSLWMAGGGVKRGHIQGESDEFGIRVVRDEVHVRDMQATMLHLLGMNHEKFTFRNHGRDFRLTDVIATSFPNSSNEPPPPHSYARPPLRHARRPDLRQPGADQLALCRYGAV